MSKYYLTPKVNTALCNYIQAELELYKINMSQRMRGNSNEQDLAIRSMLDDSYKNCEKMRGILYNLYMQLQVPDEITYRFVPPESENPYKDL